MTKNDKPPVGPQYPTSRSRHNSLESHIADLRHHSNVMDTIELLQAQAAEIEKLEADNASKTKLLMAICDDMECVPECDEHAHDRFCPVANEGQAFVLLRERIAELEQERIACHGTSNDLLDGKPMPGNWRDGTDSACPGWWRGQDYKHEKTEARIAELERERDGARRDSIKSRGVNARLRTELTTLRERVGRVTHLYASGVYWVRCGPGYPHDKELCAENGGACQFSDPDNPNACNRVECECRTATGNLIPPNPDCWFCKGTGRKTPKPPEQGGKGGDVKVRPQDTTASTAQGVEVDHPAAREWAERMTRPHSFPLNPQWVNVARAYLELVQNETQEAE